ncbi:hypothetical protein [uncultured Parasutterella sp.]|uniref:hypothetical protein n=1 Tax=uncultured Parasutterella sp. TaxID=1263098 RepID=UPI0025B694EE|nr:hypothetical protein [uncultured Parasutterella sp.]
MNYFDASRETQQKFERWIASLDFTFDLMMQIYISDGKLKEEPSEQDTAFLILLDTHFNRFCLRNSIDSDMSKGKK